MEDCEFRPGRRQRYLRYDDFDLVGFRQRHLIDSYHWTRCAFLGIYHISRVPRTLNIRRVGISTETLSGWDYKIP